MLSLGLASCHDQSQTLRLKASHTIAPFGNGEAAIIQGAFLNAAVSQIIRLLLIFEIKQLFTGYCGRSEILTQWGTYLGRIVY